MVITFSGIDGSGKSTLAGKLKSEHPEFEVMNIFHFRLINRILKNGPAANKVKNPTKGKRLIGFINLFLLFFDILLFRAYLFFTRKSVICDRYFYDVLAVHIYRYGNSRILKVVNCFVPKPDTAFFIDVDIENAQKRETGGYHTTEYLGALKNIYDDFAGRWNFRLIRNDNLDLAAVEISEIVNQQCAE